MPRKKASRSRTRSRPASRRSRRSLRTRAATFTWRRDAHLGVGAEACPDAWTLRPDLRACRRPRLAFVLSLADLFDQLRMEPGDIVRPAAGDETLVHNDFLIDPL